ncbi:putative RNA-dependent RNA polymerase 4 [Acorus calamus]|uniref:RNA-dependent RNA polymerase n=1 Tax=Acorus calamus TaxID=4465 RepID=A0AAV9EIY2_ACOCL|nr:putative RNA-dependent RNA polymerase 4 [Acorus calamus]
MTYIEDAQHASLNKKAALAVAQRHGDMDNFLVSRMILCGIPLDEPYLQLRLSEHMNSEKKGLKNFKLPINDSYYLMGTVDPTGTLSCNQVCVILDSGQVSGEVLVYKHPGLHFGDVHVLTAIYVKDMEDIIGNAKYAIFFPTKGQRSLADEIANSDFDGDMYWVSRNSELLNYFRVSKPWERIYPKPTSLPKSTRLSPEELEEELFSHFLMTRFTPSYAISEAADSWLAYMDRLLTLSDECVEEKECLREKMLQLVDIYYDAVDAPKSGLKVEVPNELKTERFPHFMDRGNSYNSTSVLGLLYDIANSFGNVELPSIEIRHLPCFSGDVPQGCLDLWSQHYSTYRSEMWSAMSIADMDFRNIAADEVIQKYKQILYGAMEFNESTRDREDIFKEAIAIYQVTYNYAKAEGDVGKCRFAWSVAGHALCAFHAIEQEKDAILCVSSVLRDILR